MRRLLQLKWWAIEKPGFFARDSAWLRSIRNSVSQSRIPLKWLIAAAVVVLAACSGGPNEPAPATIRFGETTCIECGMIISQPKYASSFAYAESERRFISLPFDDVGDMIAHMRKHPELEPVGTWVHDYETEEWLDVKAANFVLSAAIKSPMGHGVAAFADKAAAERFSTEVGGKLLDWNDLRIELAMTEHHH